MPVPLLGQQAGYLAPLLEAGLCQREQAPEGAVAIIPLEVRIAVARLGIGARGRIVTLLGHLEDMSDAALGRCQSGWEVQADPSPLGRAELFRTILRDWRDRVSDLPEPEQQVFAQALSGRPYELQTNVGTLFPECDGPSPGQALLDLGLLIPLTPGLTVRWSRVPIELLAAATRRRRRRGWLRERKELESIQRTWPDNGRMNDFDSVLKQLLLTFRAGLPTEQPGKLPDLDLPVDPARSALLLLFAKARGFYGECGIELDRCLDYFDLMPYERVMQRADYAMNLRCWDELAPRAWAEGPCPMPAIRSKLIDQLIRFTPHGVLERDLERLMADDLPAGRLYHRPVAAVARYLELWSLVDTVETSAGLLIRLTPCYAAALTLRPPYPESEAEPGGWLTVHPDGGYRADLCAPFDELMRLVAMSSGLRIERHRLVGRLDRRSLIGALGAGHGCQALAETLRRGALDALPRRVEMLLAETSAREGAVEIVPAAGVVVFRDPLDAALARQGSLGRLLGPEIAPGVVLVPDETSLSGVHKALLRMGLHASIGG